VDTYHTAVPTFVGVLVALGSTTLRGDAGIESVQYLVVGVSLSVRHHIRRTFLHYDPVCFTVEIEFNVH
jgi:hypothetical protein